MARPTVIRNEDILDAARAVFLEKGILATSAEVAQRAGVSEGSLFKRFRTKAELFRAAMGLDLDDAPRLMAQLPSLVGKGAVDQNLVRAGLDAIAYVERIFPIAMMSWSNPKVNDCVPFPNDAEPPPLKLQRLFAEYLAGEMALGRVRPVEPYILARALMGAISGYVFSEMTVRQRGLPTIDRGDYVRGYIASLWAGMRAEPAPRSARRAGSQNGKGRTARPAARA